MIKINQPEVFKDQPQFLPPRGFAYQSFSHRLWDAGERTLRFATYIPSNSKASIVLIPGTQESMEKYLESIADLKLFERGFGIYMYDPFGQGGSGRYLPHPYQRRLHSEGYRADILDLEAFLDRVVFSHRNKETTIIAFDKGANVAMRYLSSNGGDSRIKNLICVSPLLGLKTIVPLPIMNKIAGAMVGYEQGNKKVPLSRIARLDKSDPIQINPITHDPVRSKIMAHWFKANPEMENSGVTWRWFYQTTRSANLLYKKEVLEKISQDILFITAGADRVVDNKRVLKASRWIPNADIAEIPGAYHDLWLERDRYRDQLFRAINSVIGD